MSVKYKVDDSGQIIRYNYQESNSDLIEINTVNGIEKLTKEQIIREVENGARFVAYSYVFSILIMSFKRYREVYLVRPNESIFGKMFGTFMVTLIFGWWGFPWGIIWSLGSIFNNLSGGTDLTDEIIVSLDE